MFFFMHLLFDIEKYRFAQFLLSQLLGGGGFLLISEALTAPLFPKEMPASIGNKRFQKAFVSLDSLIVIFRTREN